MCDYCNNHPDGKVLINAVLEAEEKAFAKGIPREALFEYDPSRMPRCRFGAVRNTVDGLVLTPSEKLMHAWWVANQAYSKFHNLHIIELLKEGLQLGGQPYVYLCRLEDEL